MSKKIDIFSIISGHCSSLRNSDGSFNLYDFITFFILPLAVAIFGALYIPKLSEGTISLLVNFGSIFTALLLSVLVLIFDQENKADEQHEKYLLYKEEMDRNPSLSMSVAHTWIFNRNLDESYHDKKVLLKQLYFNISFSIIVSLLLVLLCLLYSNINLLGGVEYENIAIKIMVFAITFLMITIFLNILMIVKRMHVMLTS